MADRRLETNTAAPAAKLAPLPRDFYCRESVLVAEALVGKWLVRRLDGVELIGRIVETEAYDAEDPASHCFRGPTPRNRAMFGTPGHAYIYLSHGLHHCLNVTARDTLAGGGVLLRAVEPLVGIEIMRSRRGREKITDLASGPGKLGQALAIEPALYGTDMTTAGPLFICDGGGTSVTVLATPRIGISRAADRLWRFIDAQSRFVAGPRRLGRSG
jgi:DNA-3-methyladenine glycosylase